MLSTAKAQYEQGHLEAAERTLQQVLDFEPNNQTALHYLGLVSREAWLQTHPGQRRVAPQPEHLPVPAPYGQTL